VLFDLHVDGIGVDAGELEGELDAVTATDGVHGHAGRSAPGGDLAPELLAQAVQVTERIEADEHLVHLLGSIGSSQESYERVLDVDN
jgi:hypothetical protein